MILLYYLTTRQSLHRVRKRIIRFICGRRNNNPFYYNICTARRFSCTFASKLDKYFIVIIYEAFILPLLL